MKSIHYDTNEKLNEKFDIEKYNKYEAKLDLAKTYIEDNTFLKLGSGLFLKQLIELFEEQPLSFRDVNRVHIYTIEKLAKQCSVDVQELTEVIIYLDVERIGIERNIINTKCNSELLEQKRTETLFEIKKKTDELEKMVNKLVIAKHE